MTIAELTPSSAVTPATLLTPKADLFAARAARLRHLSSGHSLAPWLNRLADLCDAQQWALNALPDLDLNLCSPDAGRPLLSFEDASLKQAWQEIYHQLAAAACGFSPRETQPCASGEELDRKGRDCLALAAGEAASGPRELSEILVAAAMQVAWTAAARQLALPEVSPMLDHELCPCCGSAPVGSVVMAGDGKAGLRYLECSLCATRWNAVRARCTLCDDGGVVQYLGVENGNQAVQAESCDHCRGYIKTFFQNKDIHVDPVADDLASLALDVLVGELGYARGAPNLFLSEGEAV